MMLQRIHTFEAVESSILIRIRIKIRIYLMAKSPTSLKMFFRSALRKHSQNLSHTNTFFRPNVSTLTN